MLTAELSFVLTPFLANCSTLFSRANEFTGGPHAAAIFDSERRGPLMCARQAIILANLFDHLVRAP